MERLHILLNFTLYLICQIAAFLSFLSCNCSQAERMLICFLFSYMITDFYMGNRKIIKEYYAEISSQNKHAEQKEI